MIRSQSSSPAANETVFKSLEKKYYSSSHFHFNHK
jgi:hypothetical protein